MLLQCSLGNHQKNWFQGFQWMTFATDTKGFEDLSYALDQQTQTDVILLDFAKAFDSVPHQRLLVKLRYYGIENSICQWIHTWLTQRSQQVVLDGSVSSICSIRSSSGDCTWPSDVPPIYK